MLNISIRGFPAACCGVAIPPRSGDSFPAPRHLGGGRQRAERASEGGTPSKRVSPLRVESILFIIQHSAFSIHGIIPPAKNQTPPSRLMTRGGWFSLSGLIHKLSRGRTPSFYYFEVVYVLVGRKSVAEALSGTSVLFVQSCPFVTVPTVALIATLV